MPEVRILLGDVREKLAELPDESVHCVVTSPPYFGLRDYGVAGQIGLEPTPAEFVAVMVEVFREVRRVLRKDGTLWLNLGDSYAAGKTGRTDGDSMPRPKGGSYQSGDGAQRALAPGLKQKDLIGVPWRVAFALQADGWYLRQDIIWSKPNPMPESVTDRCTKAHEYLFLLSKSARYHYDAEAIAEAAIYAGSGPGATAEELDPNRKRNGSDGTAASFRAITDTRNRRSVWTVATQPFKEAHFATFPPDLIEPCIKAGCPKDCCAKCGAPVVRVIEKTYEPTDRTPAPNKGHLGNLGERAANMTRDGFIPNRSPVVTDMGAQATCSCDAGLARGTVLDPFGGAGTTGLVADRLQRDAILIELNPEYAAIAKERIHGDGPLFSDVALLQAAE